MSEPWEFTKHLNVPPVLPEEIQWAIDEYVPPIGDWLDTTRAAQMAALILETKPELVVEIGTFMGQSLLPQAFALRHNNKGLIAGIDPYELDTAIEGSNDEENNDWWRSVDMEDIYRRCSKLIRQDHHLERWAVLLRARSQDVLSLINHIDILYIDGNHSEESSVRDANNYVPKVVDGGYVWMDDCEWPTTQYAIKIIKSWCREIYSWGNYKLFQRDKQLTGLPDA